MDSSDMNAYIRAEAMRQTFPGFRPSAPPAPDAAPRSANANAGAGCEMQYPPSPTMNQFIRTAALGGHL